VDSSYNPKFFDLGVKILSCELLHPLSVRDLTDQVDGVLVSTDKFTGESNASALECKFFPTFANPLTISGQQFAGIDQTRISLEELAKSQEISLQLALNQFHLVAQELRKDLDRFAQLRELRRKIVAQFNAYLRTLFALHRVAHCLSGIRKVFFVEYRPFRGFSWSKRSWSLLHGSHPPKTSAQTAVLGCA
jgi:hypothetical protein